MLPEADAVAWRIGADAYDSEESWPEAFARFARAVDTARVRSLVVGAWEEAYEDGPEPVIAALLEARSKLPALRALFLGDMDSEECEISWINQGDVSPLLDGFPELEEFGVRGGTGLVFPALTHRRLRSLTIQTGGMPADAVRASRPATCRPWSAWSCGWARPTTALTADRRTWRPSWTAPGCRACAASACATATTRTR